MSGSSKEAAEALILERYASFKKSAMECISRLDGQRRDKDGISDTELYQSLTASMTTMDIAAVLVKAQDKRDWLCCFSREHTPYRDVLRTKAAKWLECAGKSSFTAFQWEHEDRRFDCIAENIDGDTVILVDPGARLLKRRQDIRDAITVAWYPVAATFREIFRQRAKSYGRLPEEKIVYDWLAVEASGSGGGGGREWATLGGLSDKSYATITISLDLRKSTFAMEQARDATRFATWMTTLISMLTKQAKGAGATFDKFTGDGVIIHYPVNPPWQVSHSNETIEAAAPKAMARAVVCAAQMVIGVQRRLEDLRKILLNDSGKFGAGVGIAIADAHWSVDLEGNPMVVGRGVVNACRAADPAPAGLLYLVNSAYQAFRDSDLAHRVTASRVSYATKEFNGDLDVSVWALEAKEVLAAADHSRGP